MMRLLALTLLVGSAGLTVHTSSSDSLSAPGVSLLQTDPLPRKSVTTVAPMDSQEELPDVFRVLVPKWLAEAVLGVSMFPTDIVPKEIQEAGAPKEAHTARAPAQAEVASSDKFPLPTSTKCIVLLCIQYMVLCTCLAVCRTCHDWVGSPRGNIEAGLKAAVQTLSYGPMVCVLFIACRMRVEFLSDGTDQAQVWVHNSMYVVTFGVLANTMLALCTPLTTGRAMPLKLHLYISKSRSISDLEMPQGLEGPDVAEDNSKVALYALTVARYLILLSIYMGIAGVIVGIHTYVPHGVTDVSMLPAPATAVMCTIRLAVVFFAAQLVIAVCRTYEEFTGTEFPTIVSIMNGAATTSEFAPMLAILFLSAQMRAQQHNDQPQVWAQGCMFIASGGMCVTTLLSMLVPSLMGRQMKTNLRTRETTSEVSDQMLGYVFLSLRFICMLSFYGGAGGVMYSIFQFQAPVGATLPVAPVVQCIVILTCTFLSVYFMVTVMLTVSEVSGGEYPLRSYRIFSALEASKTTLAFAPALAILFVATRMYALLITSKKGAPQDWVQDAMFVATWSLLVSVLACLCSCFVDKVQTDKDGNIVNKFSNRHVALVILVIRYMALFLVYGGVAMVVVGLFVMTPDAANGRGSVPLVLDAILATPAGQAFSGGNDVANLAGF